jgi:predicted RNase H-like nuclease (RuvC/YqgF family)
MAIVYVTNKKTGKKYAYESVSVWNPELKQPRAKRKYLGVVDEETGEIIPSSKKRGRKPNPDKNKAENENENEEKASSRRTYKKMVEDMQKIIASRDDEIKQLKAANRKLTSKLNRIESILNSND